MLWVYSFKLKGSASCKEDPEWDPSMTGPFSIWARGWSLETMFLFYCEKPARDCYLMHFTSGRAIVVLDTSAELRLGTGTWSREGNYMKVKWALDEGIQEGFTTFERINACSIWRQQEGGCYYLIPWAKST